MVKSISLFCTIRLSSLPAWVATPPKLTSMPSPYPFPSCRDFTPGGGGAATVLVPRGHLPTRER